MLALADKNKLQIQISSLEFKYARMYQRLKDVIKRCEMCPKLIKTG